ncbi:MAG: PQQ-binding-like beta-propeller repeat protein, partial [Candidatus Poseidoniia archaeon]|nr:PQQ-binding-like beta-propeller repeat protein [Candidatus Poseidoniia archaeon]
SGDGEYVTAGGPDEKVWLFDKDSSTPLWSYTTGDAVQSVDISVDGEYIVAGTEDNKVYLFDKDSSTPLWSYETENYVRVAISADGKYIVAGSNDDKVYAFKNSLISRPSVIPYGPRSDTFLEPPTTLRWYAGSDDRSNLTFDVYLDTSSNPTTRVAENLTSLTYNVTSLVDKGVK